MFHVEYICDGVAIIKNGRLIVCNTMDAIRASLGNREYQVIFRADALLKFDRRDGNYVFRYSDVGARALVLGQISGNNWALVDLSVQESALEEICVRLMTNDQV